MGLNHVPFHKETGACVKKNAFVYGFNADHYTSTVHLFGLAPRSMIGFQFFILMLICFGFCIFQFILFKARTHLALDEYGGFHFC